MRKILRASHGLETNTGRYRKAHDLAHAHVADVPPVAGEGVSNVELLMRAVSAFKAKYDEVTPATMWQAMEADEGDDPFQESALTIVAAVPHVCGLERSNKDVDLVYTRRRNRMSTSKLNDNLYVRVNKNVLNRLTCRANARKKKKERPLASASASAHTSDGEDYEYALESDSDDGAGSGEDSPEPDDSDVDSDVDSEEEEEEEEEEVVPEVDECGVRYDSPDREWPWSDVDGLFYTK